MKKITFLVTLFFTLILSNSHAQQIEVDVKVIPPYQLNLDGLSNQLLATVRNTNLEASANNINFRLELYGPKGLRISSNRVFDEDIDLEPGEVRQFIGNDWEALYESTNLTITPIEQKQHIINKQSLRAGKYKICITAFSTITNERLSKGVPSDCADFTVEVPDAPEIIFPIANYKIPQDGSPLNITWQQLNVKTTPTYMVEIVDLTKFPNIYSMEVEGFNFAEKVYKEDEINGFQHIVEDVDWEAGHQYAIRVSAKLGTNESALSEYKLHSKQVKITYEGNAIADDDKEVKDTPIPTPKDDEKEEAIVDNTPSNTSVGDTIYVGKNGEFPLILSELTGEKTAYEGKGTVFIDWLQARVNVSFKKITLSTDKKLLTGKVIVDIDENPPTYPKNWALEAAASNTWTNNAAKSVIDWIEGVNGKKLPYKNKMPNQFTTPLSMPFGLNFGEDNRLVLTEMMFTKDKSQFNIIAAKSTPLDWGEPQTIGFIAKSIEFHPEKISTNPKKLELLANLSIDDEGGTSYTFIAPIKGKTGCFIEWGENGISSYNLEIESELSREWVIPLNDNGTDKVKVNLISQSTKWDDLILSGNLQASEIVGSGGVEVEATAITYDMSDTKNPPGIVFPSNYNSDKNKTFRGFYAKKLKVKLPKAWKTSSNGAVEITATNMIIDGRGITIKTDAINVANFNTTNVVNMAASIDKVHVAIAGNSLTDAFIEGKLALPITKVSGTIKEESKVDYKASLHIALPKEKKKSYYQLVLNPTENQEIDFDLIKSKITLDNTSNIIAYIGDDRKTFTADLTGGVNIGDVKVGAFSLNSKKMRVEKMVLAYDSKKGFTFDKDKKMAWSFSSPQKSLSGNNDKEGFPISFKGIEYKTKTRGTNEYFRGALEITARINLTKNISGKTTFEIISAIAGKNNSKFEPKYIQTNLKKIHVNADLKVVKIKGDIEFRNSDPIYGDGFKGDIKAEFKVPKATVNALAEFGKVKNYRYWRVEAGAKFQPAIPLGGAIAFYGFGGGAYNNMEATKEGKTYTFKPKKGTAGFKAIATLGAPKIETFNADVEISAKINTSKNGGIEKIHFGGKFWVGADITSSKRAEAPIKGNVNAGYDFVQNIFDLNATVNINKKPIKANNIGFQLYVNGTTDKWFFKCGTPNRPNTVNVFGLGVHSYFMFGNDIPVPEGFTSKFSNGYKNAVGHAPDFSPKTEATSKGSNASKGSGIAMGIGYSFEGAGHLKVTGKYYVGIQGSAGAELNLALMEYPKLKSLGKGLNGWQASGSIGVYASVAAGAYTSTDGKKFKELFTVADFRGGAYMMGHFPNDTWVKGELGGKVRVGCLFRYCLFDGDYNVDFEYGKKFNPGKADTKVVEAKEETETVTIKDEVIEDMNKRLVRYIHPETQLAFSPTDPLAVKYNTHPNMNFEVEGENGKTRIFRFDTKLVLLEENPRTCNKEALYLNQVSSSIGEYLYTANTKLHLPEPLVEYIPANQNNTRNFNNPNGNTSRHSNTSRENNLAPNTNYELTIASSLQEYIKGKWKKVVFEDKFIEEVVSYSFRTAKGDVATIEEMECDKAYDIEPDKNEIVFKEKKEQLFRNKYSPDGLCLPCSKRKSSSLFDETNPTSPDALEAQKTEKGILFDAMTHGQFTNQFNGSVGLGNGMDTTTQPQPGGDLMNKGGVNYSDNTVNYNDVNTATEGSFGTMQNQDHQNQPKGF